MGSPAGDNYDFEALNVRSVLCRSDNKWVCCCSCEPSCGVIRCRMWKTLYFLLRPRYRIPLGSWKAWMRSSRGVPLYGTLINLSSLHSLPCSSSSSDLIVKSPQDAAFVIGKFHPSRRQRHSIAIYAHTHPLPFSPIQPSLCPKLRSELEPWLNWHPLICLRLCCVSLK